MNYLAVDTASSRLKILLKYKDDLFYFEDSSFKSASVKLMPEIDNLLKKAGAGLDEMDCFGCVVGPGSFTGIRIGLATIKVFSYIYSKPVIEINTLELLAFCGLSETTVAICDASSNLRYIAVYNGNGKEIMKPSCIPEDDLKSFLSLIDEPYTVLTDENSALSINNASVPFDFKIPFDKLIAYHADEAREGNLVEPLYIRKPQAVIDLEKKNNA